MCLFVQLNDIDKDHWLFTDFLHHVMHRLYNLNTAISSKYRGDLFLLAEGQNIIFFSVMFVVLRPSRLLQRNRNDYDMSCRGLHVKSGMFEDCIIMHPLIQVRQPTRFGCSKSGRFGCRLVASLACC